MRKRTKRTIFIALPLLLALTAWILVRGRLARVEAEALRLAQTGRDAMTLLGEIGAGLEARDWDRVAAQYLDRGEKALAETWWEELIFQREKTAVYKWRAESRLSLNDNQTLTQFERLLAPAAELAFCKFKLDLIEGFPAEDRAVVRALLWMRGARADGLAFESKIKLRLWLVRDQVWRVEKQTLLDGETVVGSGDGFADVAAQTGLDFHARRNPMFAEAAWRPERFEIFKYSSAGVSAADYDGDGWTDLFFADGAAAALYRNLGDGSFADQTAAAGLPTALAGVNAAVFADLDNDGDQDLLLAGLTIDSRLYRNDGGRFAEATPPGGLGGPLAATAAAADYDNDGDLDLYLGRYLDPRVDLPTTLFYTRNGAGNSLWRNDGDWRFTDVTEAAGVREGGLTLGVAWADFDEDGDQDLYVANDFGRNALLRNRGDGSFEDATAQAGLLDFGFGMSASFGDVDNDGDLDLYTSNVHSGQRWYGQAATLYQYLHNSVRQGTFMEDYPLYREILGYMGSDWNQYGDRMVKGNSLFLNDGAGGFEDVAETANANPLGWYWGSAFFDYDNDGRLDIYAANGWISGATKDDL